MPDKDFEIEVLGEVYGSALLAVAQKKNIVDEITADIRGIGDLLESNPSLVEFIHDVTIAPNEQAQAMEKIFTGRANPITVETLKVMAHRGRLKYLGGLVSAWELLLQGLAGTVQAEVTSATELSEGTISRIRDAISSATGRKADLKIKTDPEIIGGIKVLVGDTLIDASVETQLANFHEQLTRGAAGGAQSLQSVIEK